MASTIGTNIVVDGSEQFKIIEEILQYLEAKSLRKDDTKRGKLMRALADYLNIPGTTAVYHVVPGKFAEEVEEKLQDGNIPYSIIPTQNGDYLFVVGGNNKEEFLQIQNDVFSLSTDMSRQSTAVELANICKRNQEKRMVKLSFEDSGMMLIAQQKAYECGIVCGMIDKDGVKGEKGGDIYVSPGSLFNENGMDLAYFELQMALTQSYDSGFKAPVDGKAAHSDGPSLLDIRLDAAVYDEDQIRSFAQAIKNGKDMVLCDAELGKNGSYMEYKNGVVMVHDRIAGGEHPSKALDISSNASISDIEATITKFAGDIYNKAAVPPEAAEHGAVDMTKDKRRPRPSAQKAEDILLQDMANGELADALKEVSKAASLQVKNAEKYQQMSPEQRYFLKKQKMSEIIYQAVQEQGDANLLKAFLSRSSLGTKEQRVNLVRNIDLHLMDTAEDDARECKVDTDFVLNRANLDRIAKDQRASDIAHGKFPLRDEERAEDKGEDYEMNP
jgi:hypothetical protein